MALFGDDEKPGALFIQVLDWMLAPLVVVWPAAVLGTYFAAAAIAAAPFDRELRDRLDWLTWSLAVPDATSSERLKALRLDAFERFTFQVARPDGSVVAGDASLPRARPGEMGIAPAAVFREAFIDGERMRVVSRLVQRGPDGLVVQVAEPMQRRHELAGGMSIVVMWVIALLVPATVGLVWYGLRRGLAPLQRLRQRVEARAPDDLSPIAPEAVPYEIAPLVNSLNRQLERVRASLEAQRRFVADAAHQMRTPLAGLKTQAEAAQRAATLAEARERLAQIEEGADRMSRLVAQLLALARADDARAGEAPRERVSLNTLLQELGAEWAPRALARDVGFSFEPATDAVDIHGSALLLRELFSNLIDNAVRYTPAGGEISVRVAKQGRTAIVEDTGIGIPPAERPRVFDRFHRVLGSGVAGSGLGLSIVREIAELHGAGVSVDAGHGGRGTRFEVRFP